MKILFIVAPYDSLRHPEDGSVEAYVVQLANHLVRKGHVIDVIAKDTDESNSFQVIEFQESSLSMKDNSYRPSSESKGQQYYQTLQYGLYDVSRYDILHYVSLVPELYEVGALHATPSVITLHSSPNDATELLYKSFIRQTDASVIAISKTIQDQWSSRGFTIKELNFSSELHSSVGFTQFTDDEVEAYIKLYENCVKRFK